MNFGGQKNTVFQLKYKPVSNICYPIKATDMWGFLILHYVLRILKKVQWVYNEIWQFCLNHYTHHIISLYCLSALFCMLIRWGTEIWHVKCSVIPGDEYIQFSLKTLQDDQPSESFSPGYLIPLLAHAN